jgi:hypothetical protein
MCAAALTRGPPEGGGGSVMDVMLMVIGVWGNSASADVHIQSHDTSFKVSLAGEMKTGVISIASVAWTRKQWHYHVTRNMVTLDKSQTGLPVPNDHTSAIARQNQQRQRHQGTTTLLTIG